MKDFFKWFKNGAKIKRWILLILVGIALVCFAIAKIMETQEFGFSVLAMIVASFVFGFTFIIVGIVHIQKRTLELLVQDSDSRDFNKKDTNVNTLIFDKKVYSEGPKIVCIGGGLGLNTLLRGLKKYTNNITAIVTISDYGKEEHMSKEKAKELAALDDIKQSMIALSNNEEQMSELINSSLDNSALDFGDLYLKTMKENTGDLSSSVANSKNIFNLVGKILPATEDPVTICAELEDGTIVRSKEKIPEVVNEKISKISRIFLSPTNSKVGAGVVKAIEEADAIVIGPGSLYTNVIPNLLIPNITKAIRESKAFKIYVSNIMTEMGQTDGYSLSDHIKAIIDHAGRGIVDYCIYDTGEIVPEYVKKYIQMGSDIIEQDKSKVKELGVTLIQRNLSTVKNEKIIHEQDRLATAIIEIICEDLKYRDMENDSRYLLLDSKVKESKRSIKKQEKKNKKIKAEREKRKEKGIASKFAEKYKDRINTMRDEEGIGKRRKLLEENDVETLDELEEKEEVEALDNVDVVNEVKDIKEDVKEVEEVKEETSKEDLEDAERRFQEEFKNAEIESKIEEETLAEEEGFDSSYLFEEYTIEDMESALDFIGSIAQSKLVKIDDIKLFDSRFSNGMDDKTFDVKEVTSKEEFISSYLHSNFDNLTIIGRYREKPIAIGVALPNEKPYIAYNSSNRADIERFRLEFRDFKKYDAEQAEEKEAEERFNRELAEAIEEKKVMKKVLPKSKRNKGKVQEVEEVVEEIKEEPSVEEKKEEPEVQEEKIDRADDVLNIINNLRK